MKSVDGSAGGGQLLRTSLALSALTGDPVRVRDVRGARSDPGLKHQHLSAVRLLADVTDADVEGDELGSNRITFRPGDVRPGEYEVDISTAGSVTLLFDAVLPLATGIDGPLAVTATGGTDVKWSPTMAYYRRVKLPLLRRFGLAAVVEPHRPGFYPRGSGRATLRVWPSSVGASLTARGDRVGARVYSTAERSLSENDVPRRQCRAATRALSDAGVEVLEAGTSTVEAACPGTAVCVRLDYEDSLAGFDALGERGKPTEDVAEEAVEAALSFDRGRAAVDAHMADQVLPFLALEGGEARIPSVTDHVSTATELLGTFELDLSLDAADDGTVLVRGEGRSARETR